MTVIRRFDVGNGVHVTTSCGSDVTRTLSEDLIFSSGSDVTRALSEDLIFSSGSDDTRVLSEDLRLEMAFTSHSFAAATLPECFPKI